MISSATPGLSEPAALRVACVGTHGGHSGGAAIAMERLAAGMRGCGAHVDVVTRADVVGGCRLPLDRRLRRIVRHARSPVSNTMFSLDWPAWDIGGDPRVAAADVVNLHWVAGFLNAESIHRLVAAGKTVIWTLHDERGYTGGCHYASGCTGFTAKCAACPQLLPRYAEVPQRALARSVRRLSGQPIVFTTASHWLAGELARAAVFDESAHEIHVIPNGIDLATYAPTADRVACRRRLGLPESGLGILLGSVSLDERRKGAREAAVAITEMARRLPATAAAAPPFVVTYGGGTPPIEGVAARHLGPCDEQGVLAAIHACDVHLTMTREDNLPNTVMEAMACGVSVVGTRVGGLPDMITHEVDGWLVPRDDAVAAAGVLVRLATDPGAAAAAGLKARERAVADWDARHIGARFLDLARRLVGASSPAPTAGACRPLGLSPAAAAVFGARRMFRRPLRRLRRACG